MRSIFKQRGISMLVSPVLMFSIFAAAATQRALGYAGADDKGKAAPDVLIFSNGDQLTGQFERSVGGSVVFKSDMAGEITVDWGKIKELKSGREFAVVQKGIPLKRKDAVGKVVQGTVDMKDQKIELSSSTVAAPAEIPVANAAFVIDEDTFKKNVLNKPGFFGAWNGALNFGASFVQATQNSTTFNSGVSLVRATPTVPWLPAQTKTVVDFNSTYGKVTQPGTETVKTNIYHGDAEQDIYFSPRLFVLGFVAFDHNFSQGLDLQQTYGGGIGLTVFKKAKQELDAKATVNYTRQAFLAPNPQTVPPTPAPAAEDLIGSTFAELYNYHFPKGIVFTEAGSVTPEWNNTSAYSAVGSAGLALPVYKRLSLNINTADNFLNDPAPGAKKNSFQLSTGVTYNLH